MKTVDLDRLISRHSASPSSWAELVLTSFAINTIELALPVALLQVYDRILPQQALGTLYLLAAGVSVALALEMLLRVARSAILGNVAARFEYSITLAAYRHILNSDVVAFSRSSTGEHLGRFNAISTIRDHYSGQETLALLDLPFTIIYLAIMYYLANMLVLVPLFLFVLMMIFSALVAFHLRRSVSGLDRSNDRRSTFVIKVLGELFTVKSVSLENGLMRRFEQLQEDRVAWSQRVDHLTNLLHSMNQSAAQMSVLLVAGLGSLWVMNGSFSVGTLAAASLLAGRALQPLQSMTAYWLKAQTIRSARDKIAETFALPLGPRAKSRQVETQHQDRTLDPTTIPDRPHGPLVPAETGLVEPAAPPLGRLTLVDVSKRFFPDGPDVLQNIHMDVAAGELVALVGPNNSGKSVLLMIAAGLLPPSRGRVLVDGAPLDHFSTEHLRGLISYLPQSEVMFNGTIMDNITTFRPHLEQRALETAQWLNLRGPIDQMPAGFNTRVGEGPNERLPRGLAQRMAIARALVGRPRIILFDDANSAVDFYGDHAIKNMMAQIRSRLTLLLVTHRPSLLDLADRVLHIENGRLEDD